MDLEELTSNAKQIQDDLLDEILITNANTEYLRRFLVDGNSNKELFKKNVAVVSYEDVKPYIDRVANGEPSNIISGEPITSFCLSSGTTEGKQKIFPVNHKYFNNAMLLHVISSSIISKHIDVDKGKVLTFLSSGPVSTTPSGLQVASAITSTVRSDYFKNRSVKNYTSPDEVILCADTKQSMYFHLLCALVQRKEVVRMVASFSYVLVHAVKFLETYWKELCTNIRFGYISEWITDLSCRDSVSVILGGPNPELADLIEQECNQISWKGIITRLWPQIKFIQSTITGQMSQYIPILEFYSNNLPLISSTYGSSKTMFGINVNPFCKPKDVSYTFISNMSYFEFMPVDEGNNDEIVNLVNAKLGCFYEPLITNNSGLYIYRMGDILQVTGFYNKAPQFRFVRRKNMVLSVSMETTSEEDILKALSHATHVLESSYLMLMGFTCYADISTFPGHYVFYCELKAKEVKDVVEIDNKVMIKCCCVIEESFGVIYRRIRSKLGSIGALEIRVVQQGTFDSIMEYYISNGASAVQYKTPMCINSHEALAILEDKVLARFFSDKCPPL